MSGWYARWGKRALDTALSAAALVAAAPVLALVAAVIRVVDGAPVVFRQRRAGRGGEPFTLFKFRSMAVGTRDLPSSQAGALAVTPIGRVIRRTNLDELPQLVNILRGDMSIVGPRPALPSQHDLLALRRANGAAAIRPGLTGLAQVNAYDGMTVEAKAGFDGDYARRLCLSLDLAIIARTIGYLARRPPVY